MKNLRDEILAFLTTHTAHLLDRAYPGNHIPRFFAGIAIDDTAHMDVLHLLGLLRNLGVTELNGRPTEELQVDILRRVKGEEITTFYSFRLAETLLGRGPWEGNPLLEPLTDVQRAEIYKAVDSTAMFQPDGGGSIPGYPNNYWGVLGRCEKARQNLGILEDDTILSTCLEKLDTLLFTNPLGFLDDAQDAIGRYDIYSFDIHLFIEPLFEHLPADKLTNNLNQHTQIMERLIRENGASVCWGRSTGSLSVLMAMEWMALTLERNLAQDRSRSLGLIAHSFRAIQGWFEDGLVTAHRSRSPFDYRGTHRYLQLSSDLLIKLAYVADVLGKCPDQDLRVETDSSRLFPPQDHWQDFDSRSCGVWVYRDAKLSFQVPVVCAGGWAGADYAAFPAAPGVFESPVQESWPNGLPRVFQNGKLILPTTLPERSAHQPGSLSLHWSTLQVMEDGSHTLPASLDVQYTVREEGWIEMAVSLELPDEAEAISWQLAETRHALEVACESELPFSYAKIPVGGIREWRSFWSELQQVHQWECSTRRRVQYTLRFRPRFVVRELPGDHDYNRALFGPMEKGQVIHDPRSQGRPFNEMDPVAMTEGCEVLHIGWPEHWFSSHNQDPETFHSALLTFIRGLGDQPAKIVWTMHNQRPHSWDPDQGRELYKAMAEVADGVIHHSECGMHQMRELLPFREDALHRVIPHGHFGDEVQVTETREELESMYGLNPCAIRWGVFGRPQPNKQIDLILEAFLASGRDDIQLVTDAQTPGWEAPDDPRLILLPREGWLMRDEIARRAHLVDAMVAAHLPADYLTTGVFADAVGSGVPLLSPRWDFLEEMLGDSAYYHENTLESLTQWFNRLTLEDIRIGQERTIPLQARYAWPRLAQLTLDLYRDLGVTRGWV